MAKVSTRVPYNIRCSYLYSGNS